MRPRVPCRARRARGLLRAPRAGTRTACWVRRLQAADTPRVPPGAVYDITNTPNSHANEAIKTLNRFTRDTFGLGGIFHGAVEIGGEGTLHWCTLYSRDTAAAAQRLRHNATRGLTHTIAPTRVQSGPLATALTAQGCVSLFESAACGCADETLAAQVYSCTPKGNPNYTFRESIPLGVTSISTPQV